MGKGASLLAFLGKTSLGLIRELEPIPKLVKDFCLQGKLFLKVMKGTEAEGRMDEGAEEGTEVAVSVIAPSTPTLEDEPLS